MKLPALLAVASALAACNPEIKSRAPDASTMEAGSDASKAPVVDASAPDVREAGPADDAMPDAASPSLNTRMQHLLEAIAKNSPELAADVLFPRDGWSAARDERDPAKTWDGKTKPAFDKSLARYAKRIKGVDRAVFVSFELGRQIVRITPKHHDWKEPLWRVKHSTLSITVDGRAQRIDVAEMVSWRGNWYVTKLH